MATIEDFLQLDIRVGEVLRAEPFPKAKKPAYQLWVDFGGEIGVLTSSAQITEQYEPEALVGKQVLGVVNFPPRQVANFMSQALILGACTEDGVILIRPETPVPNGTEIH